MTSVAHRVDDPERKPVDQELFDRTAPRWNCVDYPDGMHYMAGGRCLWCGRTGGNDAVLRESEDVYLSRLSVLRPARRAR
jgi:hypothetical protein